MGIKIARIKIRMTTINYSTVYIRCTKRHKDVRIVRVVTSMTMLCVRMTIGIRMTTINYSTVGVR